MTRVPAVLVAFIAAFILTLSLGATTAHAQKSAIAVHLSEQMQMRIDKASPRLYPLSYDIFREGLRISYEGEEPVALILFAGLLQRNEVAREYRSEPFKVEPGEAFLPGDQFVPSDQFVPGDQFAGDQFVPGDQFIINGIVVEEHMLRAVQQAREAHRRDHADALFLIALPEDREAAEGMRSQPLIVLFPPER